MPHNVLNAPEGAEDAWNEAAHLADGIEFTRELVTEPANIIYPETFGCDPCEGDLPDQVDMSQAIIDRSLPIARRRVLQAGLRMADYLDVAFEHFEYRPDLLFTEQETVAGEGVGYGFGWFVQTDAAGRRLLGHSGGSVGGTSLMLIRPDTRVVIVGLINLTGARNGVLRDVLRIFVEAAEASFDYQ